MRLLWLPDVLRDAGLTVREVSGWRTRGSDSWGPIRGVTCHATAGSRGSSDAAEINVLLNGSPTAPPPIAQLYLSRTGVWHIVASGRCNHNLVGWGGPNQGLGNSALVGVEAGNDNRGEPWPTVQLRSYERGVAAICRRLGIPASRVAGHKEHQPGNKSDPLGINMTSFRSAVARLIEGDDDDMTKEEFLQHLQYALPRVEISLTSDLDQPSKGQRYWAGDLMGLDQASFRQICMWSLGIASDKLTKPQLVKIRAELAGLTAAVAGQDMVTAMRSTMRQEFATLGAALSEELGDAVTTDSVEAALRRVLGSLDES